MKSKRILLANRLKKTMDVHLQNSKLETYRSLVSGFMEDHGLSDESKLFSGHLRARRADKLIGLATELERSAFKCGYSFPHAQAAQLIKKYPFDEAFTGLDPKGTAISTFLQAEDRCSRWNEIIRHRKAAYDPICELKNRARNWIRYVIGDEPNYKAIYRSCGVGPGASIGIHGQGTSLVRKLLSDSWTSTEVAFPYFVAAVRPDPLFWELLVGSDRTFSDYSEFRDQILKRTSFVEHNKICFVPKTAKTDRSIAIEPLLNSWLQKGADEYLRGRLKRVGLDLSDQSPNQALAYEGSRASQSNPFCTIDLSAASDSISIEIVRELLPPSWFCFLNDIRSPSYELDGITCRYNKFTSMGNGFCFPLETLIFGSICHACGAQSSEFRVYGDDIIVRQDIFESVINALVECGFTPNSDKTFNTGLFRESCGADWYNGSDVRPITLDYELDSVESLFKISNISRRRQITDIAFEQTRERLRAVIGNSNPFVRPFTGPDDTALEVPMDIFQLSDFATYNNRTFSWRWLELLPKPILDRYKEQENGYPTVLLMAALRGVSSRMPFVYRRKTRTTYRWVSTGGASSTWTPKLPS